MHQRRAEQYAGAIILQAPKNKRANDQTLREHGPLEATDGPDLV